MKLRSRYIINILGLAVLYVIAAKLGLSLAFSVKEITTVWPPSGLALAALILFGNELWPGVLIGAFVANFLTNEPVAVAFGIAIGNTLEALVGATLLRRVLNFSPALKRVRGVLGLVFFAAVFSTMISATVGTVSLGLGGLLNWGGLPRAWLLWWFGDMAGVILFAPVIMVWYSSWRQILRENLNEFGLLLISTAIVSLSIFFEHMRSMGVQPQGSYLVFPFVIWAAFRLKQLGITAVSLMIAIIAILGTVVGYGPFANAGSTEQQLVSLLTYIILISISGLLMAVTVSQRDAYAFELRQQTEKLSKARDKIESELIAKTRTEEELSKSNDRIVGILSRLLDESPQHSKRDR